MGWGEIWDHLSAWLFISLVNRDEESVESGFKSENNVMARTVKLLFVYELLLPSVEDQFILCAKFKPIIP